MAEAHNQQLEETKKKKFTLSTSNKIYLACVSTLYIIFFIVFADKSVYSSPERMGELAGEIVAYLLFPLLVAWLAWRISGGKDAAASIAYNIVLSLFVLGLLAGLSEAIREAEKKQAMKNMEVAKETLKEDLANAIGNPEELDFLTNQYVEKANTMFEELSRKSTGIEARAYEAMGELVRESMAVQKAWKESYKAMLHPSILDLSVLSSEQEIKRQKEALKTYVRESKRYREQFLGMVDNLKTKLTPLGLQNECVKGVLNGAANAFERQRPIMIPLLDAHIEYGESRTEILSILEAELGKWFYVDDTLLFKNEKKLKRVRELYQRIGELEVEMSSLSGKMVEAL